MAARFTELTSFDQKLYPGDLVGLEFLNALKSATADDTYGDSVATDDYDETTNATLSTMISEVQGFWTTGAPDEGSATLTKGFSATTPYETFQCATSTGTAAAWSWVAPGASLKPFTSRGWATALWAWHLVYGYDATVAAIWTWLMTFTTRPSHLTSDSASPYDVSIAATGTFDPTLSLTIFMYNATDSATVAYSSSIYDWACMGLLASIQYERNPLALKTAKETIAPLRFRVLPEFSGGSGVSDDIKLRGKSGLTLQTGVGIGATTQDTVRAAQVGLAYRYQPTSADPDPRT